MPVQPSKISISKMRLRTSKRVQVDTTGRFLTLTTFRPFALTRLLPLDIPNSAPSLHLKNGKDLSTVLTFPFMGITSLAAQLGYVVRSIPCLVRLNYAPRAVGIGYVEEFLARLEGHVLDVPDGSTQDNITLDESKVTFPLNQKLYFDFSHDTNIAGITTAFGLTQFAQFLPETGPPNNQQQIVSHMEPFGARLDIEIITAPSPIAAKRPNGKATYHKGRKTT
jgi:hypothetical protein